MDPTGPAAVIAAFALAAAVALLLPGRSTVRRRLRSSTDTGRAVAGWQRISRGVPGAPTAETRSRVAMTAGGVCGVVVLSLGSGAGAGSGPGPGPFLGPILVGVSAVVAYVASGRIVSPATRRRRRRLAVDLPGALDLMAACLAAGLPVRGAAAAVAGAYGGPLAEDVGGVLAQVAIGDSEAHAWLRLGDDPVWSLVARDLARSVESGSTLVDLLRTHAERSRKEWHAVIVARARTVGVRSVLPLMTCYLPAFMLVGIVPVIAGAVPRLLG